MEKFSLSVVYFNGAFIPPYMTATTTIYYYILFVVSFPRHLEMILFFLLFFPQLYFIFAFVFERKKKSFPINSCLSLYLNAHDVAQTHFELLIKIYYNTVFFLLLYSSTTCIFMNCVYLWFCVCACVGECFSLACSNTVYRQRPL